MTSKIIRDFTPSADNNRNSEGAFITLGNGDILFAWSRYGAEGDDDGAVADIYACVSADGGETFGEPYPLITHGQMNATTLMSTTLMRMANGDIGMFFLAKTEVVNCLCYLIRSGDEGKTWGEPVLCSEDKGYFVVNNDRVIRTSDGRILVPAAKHGIILSADGKMAVDITPGEMYMFASDDDGYSWHTVTKGITLPVSRGCTTGVQEPGLLELDDGRLWCYIRTDSGRQYETFSDDGGVSWCELSPSFFTSAESPLSAKRLSDGRIIVVWNPVPLYNGRDEDFDGVWTGARTPLALALSIDDTKNFFGFELIETDERSGYCYVAIHETQDGSVLLGYCAGGVEDGCTLNRLRIRKITL
ncbi:MAG: exo-alpha-sialidase [Clostridia bacterium]|nr:exo-alpha-sialidase [Clostridia bacterium]